MISYLWAMDETGLIGKDNDLPWYLPNDLKYFKRLTMDHVIVMGRNTHESIGKPLPGRTNVVLTSDEAYVAEGCEVHHSPESILKSYSNEEELFVIGGAGTFNAFWPHADRMYVTILHETFDGDTYFNGIDWEEWTCVSSEEGKQDERNRHPHTFYVYDREKK